MDYRLPDHVPEKKCIFLQKIWFQIKINKRILKLLNPKKKKKIFKKENLILFEFYIS